MLLSKYLNRRIMMYEKKILKIVDSFKVMVLRLNSKISSKKHQFLLTKLMFNIQEIIRKSAVSKLKFCFVLK